MTRTTRTLIDADYYEDVEATLNNHGQLILYNTDTRDELNLSASQASALRDMLNEHFADASNDDALASLDRELRGHPMGEVNAVVAGVPVAVTSTSRGVAK